MGRDNIHRRGSSEGDLQHRTLLGAQGVDIAEGESGSIMHQAEIVHASPPPAVDWEIHGFRVFGSVLTRNPTAEEVTAKPRTMMAVSYDEDGIGDGGPIEADSVNFLESDDIIWTQFNEQHQPFQGQPLTGADNPAGVGNQFTVGAMYDPLDGGTIELSDMEDLVLHGAASYPTGNTVGGGERTIHMRGGLTIYYKPEDCGC